MTPATATKASKAAANGKVSTVRSRFRPTGSSPDDPLVPFQAGKIRRSDILELQRAAMEASRSASSIVRELVHTWAERRRDGRKARGVK